MSTKKLIIAISFDERNLYGCPYCGHRSASASTSTANCTVCECIDCKKTYVLLGGELRQSSIGFGDPPVYPKLQIHPRSGIPSHGNSDVRPDTGGDFFYSRGIGKDDTPGCFVCGGDHTLYNNISGFVRTKDAGERILALFPYGARLDYRSSTPDRVQVKIGACDTHKKCLEKLDQLCADKIINKEKINEAKG